MERRNVFLEGLYYSLLFFPLPCHPFLHKSSSQEMGVCREKGDRVEERDINNSSAIRHFPRA